MYRNCPYSDRYVYRSRTTLCSETVLDMYRSSLYRCTEVGTHDVPKWSCTDLALPHSNNDKKCYAVCTCTVWVKKSPLRFSDIFFANSWEFSVYILRAYYTFPSTPDYKFLFHYFQLCWSYAILSATIQFTSHVQNVYHQPKRTLAFSDIFPKQLGIFRPNYTHLLPDPTYARAQMFI